MALSKGFYWYKGPTIREGHISEQGCKEWTVVEIGDGWLSFIGSDWDADPDEVAVMENLGRFIPVEPPNE